MSDITKRFGIITGGTGSFGSLQFTDGDADGSARVEIFDHSKNLKNITSVSASGAGQFGGNVTVGGNLSVAGTTTTVNSTAIELGDKIITLNSSNTAGDAGLYVNDTDTNQTGSLLWDSDQNAWMGGLKDAEVHLVNLSSAQTLTNKTLTSPTISAGDINSPDIDGGTIDGATIATSDVTVGSGKTLDVSAGTLTTSAAQKLAIMQGAGANVDIGAFDLRASTLTADSATQGRVAIYGANGVLSEDSDLSFSGDTLTVTKLGAYEQAGAVDFSDEAMTNVNIDSGAIDGATIGAASPAASSFTTVSASSYVSASSFEVDGQASIKYQSSALDFSSGGAGAKLSTTMFSASVEVQGPSMEVSGAAKVGSLSIAGTAISATAAEINYLDNSDLTAADIQKLADITATAAEINDLTSNAVDSSDFTKLSNITATAAEINDLAGNAVDSSDFTKLSNVSATAAELNYLDNDALTAADITKLAALDSTAAEINILDGDTAASSVTVADADRIVLNDGGTMKQVAMTDFEVYFESALDSVPNVVTVGALNAGSISSGFGNIDVGSSAVSAGTISGSSSGSFASLSLDSGTAMTSIKDEDNMGSDSATALATQQSIKAYVDAQVTAQDLDFSADSGGALSIDLDSESLTVAGTSNEITTAGSGNTITIGLPDDVTIGDDLTLGSDGAVLNFGGDSEVSLTHVHNAGLLLTSSMKLQFRDATEFVHSDANGYMHMEGASGVHFAINGSDRLQVANTAVTAKVAVALDDVLYFNMGSNHRIENKMGSHNITLDTASANVTIGGNVKVGGNSVQDAGGNAALTFDGSGNTDVNGTLAASGHITLDNTKDLLAGGADCEIGSSTTKFAAGYFTNVYTGDMHLKNERGDWTIFEESDHLRIRNNLTGLTYKMGMTLIEG
jgi:hypothetical protein